MMKRGMVVLALVCVPSLALAEVKIPLTVQELTGSGGPEVLVSGGVPLLPGQVKDLGKLALVDEKGQPVLSQFRDLARWWRQDGSLRWVLVDFKAAFTPFGVRRFTLTDAGNAPGPSPLKVTATDDAIVITTGTAQFTLNRKKFNLFDRVRLDANGDGQYADDEEVVSPNADLGTVVTDTFGTKYYSSEGTTEVKVEEAGPVRVCVLARGTHKARGGEGYSLGMYGFEVRLHFIAGQNLVKLDALITNNGPKPNGSPTFEDFSLVSKLNLAGKGQRWKMYGVAPVEGSLPPGESCVLYQDSCGSENWRINPGLSGDVRDVSSFRGYRILSRTKDGEKTLFAGDQARGLAQFGDDRCGVVVCPNYFWQLFPKAVEVGGDGTLRVAVFPAEYKAVHWVEDASAAGQVIWLNFYATAQKAQFALDERKRPWPHVVDDLYKDRLSVRCTLDHYAACGALADVGPYLPIGQAASNEQLVNEPISVVSGDFPLEVTERRYFMTDYLKGNAYGWQVFGCRWEEYAGHSPWNYEPIGSSYFLFNYINTGGPRLWEFGQRRFKHFRDVRAYKIDGTDVWGFKTWQDFSRSNVAEEWCSRKGLYPTGEEVQKYSAGRYNRAGWFGPNPEHANLDDLYDLYCLTGDTRCYEGMRNIAAYGGALVGLRQVAIGRDAGWAFRAVLRYHDLTRDQEALTYITPALDHFWNVARQNRSVDTIKYDNNWFMDVFSRATVMANDIMGDERMRDLTIGLSRGRTATKGGYPTMLAFCWDQTGLGVYKNDAWANYARLGGYFPACAGYLWGKPRPDQTAPAAVKDLTAALVDGGVELAWTAPGDDGAEGAAALYQIKFDDLPIVETAERGSVNFWAANNVADEPKPAKAGARQTFTLKGLKPGTYYFALKTRDEVNNESPISNCASVVVK
jgi:hypothetical protein